MRDDLNTHFFSKKMYRWTTGTLKRDSKSLIIREMQIKTTIGYSLTVISMVFIKNTTDKKCWLGCREENPHALLVGMQIGSTSTESSMEPPWKINAKTTIQPRNSTLGHLSKENENNNLKRYGGGGSLVTNLCPTFVTPWTVAH